MLFTQGLESCLEVTIVLVFQSLLILGFFLSCSNRLDSLTVFQLLYTFYYNLIARLQSACYQVSLTVVQVRYGNFCMLNCIVNCNTKTNFLS